MGEVADEVLDGADVEGGVGMLEDDIVTAKDGAMAEGGA